MCTRAPLFHLPLLAFAASAAIAGCSASLAPGVAALPAAADAGRTIANAPATRSHVGPGKIITFPGAQLVAGYDLDQNGTLGYASTASRIETFDQTTGTIASVFTPQSGIVYGVEGIFAGKTGLIQRDVPIPHSIFSTRHYSLMAPFTAKNFTGDWTPPVDDIELLPASNQVNATTAFYAFELKNNDRPIIFSSNVAANTFGPVIKLDPNKFSPNFEPIVSYYAARNEAVLAISPDGGARGGLPPVNYIVDLGTGTVRQFNGFNNGPFHAGHIQGMALDPNTGIEATTTELNSQVEFYNVKTQQKVTFAQPPCTRNGDQGLVGGVTVDAVNKLFIVAGTMCRNGFFVTGMDVYDETGKLVEVIPGLRFFPAQPAAAIDPKNRVGWTLGPNENQLQQFFY